MMKKLDEEKENKEKENKEKTLEQISQPEANKIISPPKKKTSKKKVSKPTTTKKVSAATQEKSKEKSKKAAVKETKKPRPKQQDQKTIIDEFIESNPKIKPDKPTNKKKPSEDLSAKSTEFKPEASSEYLARYLY